MQRERRATARIAVPLNARLVTPAGELDMLVRDVSPRGVFLYTREPPVPVGKLVTVKLSLTAGIKPIAILARVARIQKDPLDRNGTPLGIGLHFLPMREEERAQLLDLLDRAMLGRGTKMRAYPRVQFLVEVTCRTQREVRAFLRDIGEGGVGLKVDQRLDKNEEGVVEVALPGGPSLRIAGWVMSCDPIRSEPRYFRVGFKFARLSAEARNELQSFMKALYRR